MFTVWMLDSVACPTCNHIQGSRHLPGGGYGDTCLVNGDFDISFDDDEDDFDHSAPESEKRKAVRLRREYIWMQYEKRKLPIVDISRNGMYVRTKIAELPPSRIFKIDIVAEIDDKSFSIPGKAQVVRHEKSKGYALRYETAVEVWNNLFPSEQKPK